MATKSLEFLGLGKTGLVLDKPPYALDPAALTGVRNVRLSNERIQNFSGHTKICTGDIEVYAPYHILTFPTDTDYYWSVSGLDDEGETDMCLSRGDDKIDVKPVTDFVITPNDQWSGGVFNGVPVLCNGDRNPAVYLKDIGTNPIYEDMPYKITPGDPPVIDSTWRDVGFAAKIVRPFKNFLIAFDITDSNERYPYMMQWSDAVDPGLIPAWDWTDPKLLTGRQLLPETSGFVIDFLPMGDVGMIYKEDSVWSCTVVQSNEILRVRQALPSVGILAPNCAAQFKGQHLVLTDGDVIVHNGATQESIIEDRIKKYIFRVLDTDYFKSSFVARNDQTSEIWVCIPTQGQKLPDIAAIWNWRDNTWTLRDLPLNTSFMVGTVDISSQVFPVSDPWGGDKRPTDPPETPEFVPYTPTMWGGPRRPTDPPETPEFVPYVPKAWGERDFNPAIKTMVSVGESGIFKMDDGLLFDGAAPECRAERDNIPLDGQDRGCTVRRVYPLMDGTGPVNFYIGSQPAPNAPVSWEGPREFNPGADSFFSVRRAGKMHAWKIESRNGVEWSLYGLKWVYTPGGTQ